MALTESELAVSRYMIIASASVAYMVKVQSDEKFARLEIEKYALRRLEAIPKELVSVQGRLDGLKTEMALLQSIAAPEQ